MNKKIYSFAMMALLALGSATPLVAQETEEVVTEEAAAQPFVSSHITPKLTFLSSGIALIVSSMFSLTLFLKFL